MSPLRVGVCGTAHWARTVHLPGWRDMPGFELAGVFGRDRERTRALADAFALPAFLDYERFLAEVDVVSFVVPPAVQAELALRAADAGRHLLLEKPVAPDAAAARLIGAAVEARGLGASCFLTRAFIPEIARFAADARRAGVRSAEASFLSSALSDGSPYAGSQWRRAEDASIWDVGPHMLTTLANLLGPVEQVSARRAAEGAVEAELIHAAGRRSRFTINQTLPLGPLRERLVVETADGERRLDGVSYDRVAAFRLCAGQLSRAIAGEREAQDAFRRAVAMVATLEAAARSFRETGAWMPVPGASAEAIPSGEGA